ncbi:uncharacterized protein PSFLO_06869 [Pseudozyma flocculosa]|uniref:Uncharacterized protein n=1 Tax=Pseudozyma flocculosa TaxID=84751 RepID=A0A5C3FCN1_9BASI|nr:uncharacterized protein PSFLO_06869 [Pseudozyma flocculosa]
MGWGEAPDFRGRMIRVVAWPGLDWPCCETQGEARQGATRAHGMAGPRMYGFRRCDDDVGTSVSAPTMQPSTTAPTPERQERKMRWAGWADPTFCQLASVGQRGASGTLSVCTCGAELADPRSGQPLKLFIFSSPSAWLRSLVETNPSFVDLPNDWRQRTPRCGRIDDVYDSAAWITRTAGRRFVVHDLSVRVTPKIDRSQP